MTIPVLQLVDIRIAGSRVITDIWEKDSRIDSYRGRDVAGTNE